MSTITEGYYNGVIKSVEPIEPRFKDMGENAFELLFVVDIEEKGEFEVFLEVSQRYGQGTLQNKTQLEITNETLKGLGYEKGNDLSDLDSLTGKACRIRAKEGTNGRMNFYFSSNNRTAIAKKDVQAKMKAILQQVQNSSVSGAASDENPFG